MSEKFEVGAIIEGEVTAIKPFGAFVALDEKTQGLVHISQVSHGFVKDINEVLSVGQKVNVKIMSIDEESGKISLSIKETQEPPAREERPKRTSQGGRPPRRNKGTTAYQDPQGEEGFNTFEDKLKNWLKQSNENQEAINKRAKR
jgi:general stress protein 13